MCYNLIYSILFEMFFFLEIGGFFSVSLCNNCNTYYFPPIQDVTEVLGDQTYKASQKFNRRLFMVEVLYLR